MNAAMIEQIRSETSGVVFAALLDAETGALQEGAFSSFEREDKPLIAYALELNERITKQLNTIHQNTEQLSEMISHTGEYMHIFRYIANRKYLLYLITDTTRVSMAWVRHVLQKYDDM